MAGPKGIEKGEGRLGEFAREEVMKIDASVKAGGFYPDAATTVLDSFRSNRPQGFEQFLEIGVTGRGEASSQILVRDISRDFPTTTDIYSRETLGLTFWVNGIREFFGKTMGHLPLSDKAQESILAVVSYVLTGESMTQMSPVEFKAAREALETNTGAPRTQRFFTLVAYENSKADFHDTWVTRGRVEVEEAKVEVKVTSTGYAMEAGIPYPTIPAAPDAIQGYRLHAGGEDT